MDLINQLLTYNPEQRISAIEALHHMWIKQSVKDKLDKNLAMVHFKNLKEFRVEQKLQQAALTYIVCQLSTKSEQAALYETFKALDLNGDGRLEEKEFMQGLMELETKMSDQEIK